jgi:hypothetical protein
MIYQPDYCGGTDLTWYRCSDVLNAGSSLGGLLPVGMVGIGSARARTSRDEGWSRQFHPLPVSVSEVRSRRSCPFW